MKISVILPILNEEKIISSTINKIINKLKQTSEDYEIIAVNDGSTDDTLKVLNSLHKIHPKLKVINHTENIGYGAAFQSGVKKAKYEWLLFMDSDMQFEINDLDNFIQYIPTSDFIIGYRSKRADNIKRIFFSKVYNKLVRLLFGINIIDIDCAFKLMRKSSVNRLGVLPTSFFVSTTLLVKAIRSQVRIVELPVNHLPRTRGSSTVTLMQVIRTLKDLVIIYIQLTLNPLYTYLYLPINKFFAVKKYE